MVSFKDRFLQDVRERFLGVGVIFALLPAGYGIYGYYKHFFWSYADAIVETIEPTCNYYKKYWLMRGGDWESVDCEARDEAAKLIADGYEFTGPGQTVRVVYEAELGRKTYAILSSWPSEAGPAKLGSGIRVRYSPSTPSRAEPASDPDNDIFIVSGLIFGLSISGHAILNSRRRKERSEQ